MYALERVGNRMQSALPRLVALMMLLVSGPRIESVHHELLQSKIGSAEYVAAMVRLTLRNPVDDARADAARGDLSVYCVGTIGCFPPGLDAAGPLPSLQIQATATTGCIITGGASEMRYREIEEGYVSAYNRAKLDILRTRSATAG
jgi:hypothetical protein